MKVRRVVCCLLAAANIAVFVVGALPRQHAGVRPILTPHPRESPGSTKQGLVVRFLDASEARQRLGERSAEKRKNPEASLTAIRGTPDSFRFRLIGHLKDAKGELTYFVRDGATGRIVNLSAHTTSPKLGVQTESTLQFEYEGQIYEVTR